MPNRLYFSPLHLQPSREQFRYGPGDFSATERVAASTLALPFSAGMTTEEVSHVASALVEAVGRQFRS